MENKTAIRLNKLDAFQTEILANKLREFKAIKIDNNEQILQFNNGVFELVLMTTRQIVDFKTFMNLNFNTNEELK